MVQDDRLERLTHRTEEDPDMRARSLKRYSSFIRKMRLFLPIFATALAAVVFVWMSMEEEQIVKVQEAQPETQKFGQNELINPRFESLDEKRQAYTITAERAIQGEEQDQLILLEKPLADMLLKSGSWVAIEAMNGAYRQDTGRLLLEGAVKIFHDAGYQVLTEKLDVDLEGAVAWSDVDIKAQGPEGTLLAKGVRANNKSGEVIFQVDRQN